MIYGSVAKTATSVANSIANAWASVASAMETQYQLLGFSAGSSNIACSIDILFGATSKLKYQVGASTAAISEWYGDLGPVTGSSEALIVHTNTQAGAAKACYANLFYRIVL